MQTQTAEHWRSLNAIQNWENGTTRELMRLTMEQLQQLGTIDGLGYEASFGYVMHIVSFQSELHEGYW